MGVCPSPPQQLVSKDRYEVREEVGRHAVGEDKAELALHPAAGHFEKPREGLRREISSSQKIASPRLSFLVYVDICRYSIVLTSLRPSKASL